MPALRLSFAGAVTLTLSVGIAGVVAQDESGATEPDGSALLSFSMPYLNRVIESPRVEFGEGRILHRGEVLEQPIDSGDPRLSGTLGISLDWDTHADSSGIVAVGAVHIDNEDGAWQGTSLGYSRPGWSRRHHQYNLTGEGAYEGLSAILFLIDDGTGFAVEGIVFPGELPPIPEYPASAE